MKAYFLKQFLINFFDSKIPVAELKRRLAEYCDVTAMSFAHTTESDGEISCKGINKAFGIQQLIDYAGIEHALLELGLL